MEEILQKFDGKSPMEIYHKVDRDDDQVAMIVDEDNLEVYGTVYHNLLVLGMIELLDNDTFKILICQMNARADILKTVLVLKYTEEGGKFKDYDWDECRVFVTKYLGFYHRNRPIKQLKS